MRIPQPHDTHEIVIAATLWLMHRYQKTGCRTLAHLIEQHLAWIHDSADRLHLTDDYWRLSLEWCSTWPRSPRPRVSATCPALINRKPVYPMAASNPAHDRDKWLVLFLWPLDFTFVCPTEIRAYSDLGHDFDVSGTTLLGASVDSAYVHRAWVMHGLGAVKFPLLGNVARAFAQGFGVLADSDVAVRATFIINPQGRVMSIATNDLNVGRSSRETLRLPYALLNGEFAACEWQPGQSFVAAA